MTPKKALHHPDGAACGCEAQEEGRKAVAVDPDMKAANLRRLRRIEGQIRGLQKMVEGDRYCADIMVQGRALMRNHLRHCAAQAIGRGSPEEAEAMYDEILELIYKHSR
jgi:CsoR family transcriptional regulator, copper-sensing transcriptional repressor